MADEIKPQISESAQAAILIDIIKMLSILPKNQVQILVKCLEIWFEETQ